LLGLRPATQEAIREAGNGLWPARLPASGFPARAPLAGRQPLQRTPILAKPRRRRGFTTGAAPFRAFQHQAGHRSL